MGPRTEPCGSLDDTAILSDFTLFKTTACNRESKKSLTHPMFHKSAISISVSRVQLYQTPDYSPKVSNHLFPHLHVFSNFID